MDVFTIPGREYDSNIYVIVGKNTTVIDSGTGFYSQMVTDTIQKVVKSSEITQVLLTHEHFDHVGGVPDILQTSKRTAKIFASKTAVSKLKDGESSFAVMLGGVMPKLTVDVPLSGGERLMLGDDVFEVLLTPGHSIGSLCFYSEKSKILFSGDTVFAHGGFGRYDFPGGNFDSLVDSIERLSLLDVKNLYPGHGSIVEGHGKEHVLQAFLNIRSWK